MYDDTITAIATASGEAGIAVVRLSGPGSAATLRRIFQPAGEAASEPRRIVHGWVVDANGERVDEALAVIMPGPHSFTGEDVAEIHCHGGRQSPRRVLETALAAGARLAEPGEFSLRAFLNGRLDLAQAEALLDVVQARTPRAHQLALEGLAGRLSTRIRELRALLLQPLAYLEARLDFAEEDLPGLDPRPDLESALNEVRDLRRHSEQGIVYRQGVRAAIVGRPNVGKSSLLNALLRVDRAIVTEIPGTTRDTVEEVASLDGIPFWLIDTAGLREAADPVEQIGVKRSRQTLQTADLVLLVLDGSVRLTAEDRALCAELAGHRIVVVLNKSDLPSCVDPAEVALLLPDEPCVAVSALHGGGLQDLERLMARSALNGPATDPFVTNPRHRDALRLAERALTAALAARAAGLPDDVQAGEVAAAVNALGEITGENATEDLLEAIFSRFCIGK